jgi:transcriptional regulator with XRE-family HTH domain
MPAQPRPPARKSARKPAAAPSSRQTRQAPNGLGGRLRAARERAGVSLRELARRVSVSPSLVSQIERGSVKPSVGTLYAMANELGLVLDELFRDREPAPGIQPRGPASAVTAGPVQPHDSRKTIRLASGVRWERLTAAPDKDVEFLRVVYDVGSASCEEDALMRHGGTEYALMISGRLGVRIGFEEYRLGPGDSISFNAQAPHRLWTIGKQPAVAIWVVVNRHGDKRKRR